MGPILSFVAPAFLILLTCGCAKHAVVREVVPHPSVEPVTLAFVGDILMGASAAPKLAAEGPHAFFGPTAPILRAADAAVGNLEGPLSRRGRPRPGKTFTFRTDPSAVEGLKEAGFDALTLANNHILDYGPEALEDTIRTLQEAGIAYAGAGENLAAARRPAWLEVKGRRLALLSYSRTLPTDFWASRDRPGCAPALENLVAEDVAAARAAGAHLVVVCMHWGREKSTSLRAYQRSVARAALEAGADAVVGHHPHVWQALELLDGRPVAYSIGNFVFGSRSPSVRESGILLLSFGEHGVFRGGEIIPLDVFNHRVDFTPVPLEETRARAFFEHLAGLSPGTELSFEGGRILWKASPPTLPPPRGLPFPTESAPAGGVPAADPDAREE